MYQAIAAQELLNLTFRHAFGLSSQRPAALFFETWRFRERLRASGSALETTSDPACRYPMTDRRHKCLAAALGWSSRLRRERHAGDTPSILRRPSIRLEARTPRYYEVILPVIEHNRQRPRSGSVTGNLEHHSLVPGDHQRVAPGPFRSVS